MISCNSLQMQHWRLRWHEFTAVCSAMPGSKNAWSQPILETVNWRVAVVCWKAIGKIFELGVGMQHLWHWMLQHEKWRECRFPVSIVAMRSKVVRQSFYTKAFWFKSIAHMQMISMTRSSTRLIGLYKSKVISVTRKWLGELIGLSFLSWTVSVTRRGAWTSADHLKTNVLIIKICRCQVIDWSGF